MTKEVILKSDESLVIITPYGEMRIRANKEDQRGDKESIKINTGFENMYLKPVTANELNIFITKNCKLTQERIKKYYNSDNNE